MRIPTPTIQANHRRGLWRIAAALLVVSILFAACAGDDDADDSGTDVSGESEMQETPQTESGSVGGGSDEADATDDSGTVNAEEALQSTAVPDSGVKIIRDASIEIHVDDFDAAWSSITRTAAQVGGYISNATTDFETVDEQRYAFGSATIRIPSERFDEVLSGVAGLGERISQTVNGQDVTEEYVDIEARLRHWRSVEMFTLGLMEQATTIEESLEIQQRLDDVQLTIEQLAGRQRYLDSRVAFSTITVGITELPTTIIAVAPAPDPSPISQAFDDGLDMILEVVGFMIVAAAFALPFVVVLLFAYALYRLVRRLRPTAAAATPPPSPTEA